MKNFGENTAAGFLPSMPQLEELMRGKGILNEGFSALNNTTAGKHLADEAVRPHDELKRSYYRHFTGVGSQQDADAVLEDMINQTLRRAMVMPKPGMTFEQLAPYMAERHGQNGLMIYILKMMQDGLDLPAPDPKKKGKKK